LGANSNNNSQVFHIKRSKSRTCFPLSLHFKPHVSEMKCDSWPLRLGSAKFTLSLFKKSEIFEFQPFAWSAARLVPSWEDMCWKESTLTKFISNNYFGVMLDEIGHFSLLLIHIVWFDMIWRVASEFALVGVVCDKTRYDFKVLSFEQ
jgi:hypothetical protein